MPLKTTQVEQSFDGDRNVGIGVAEAGSHITITYGASPLPTGDPNPFGVPYLRNRYFTGRQSVLEQLHQQLNQETTAAITQVQAISGLGGIGKTQTAVEYAYRYHHDRCLYDTVFWVKADTEVNLTTDFAQLAKQLALPVAQGTQEKQIPAVKAWLAKHDHWLLIFDNADTPDWLIPFMPNNPKGKVIITSRATVFDQLGIDSPLALDVLPPEEAISLLFRRTGHERTDTAIAAATEINQVLDGLPLALEQASAFMVRKHIGFQTYLHTYRKQGLSQLEKAKARTGQYPSSVLKTWVINFQAIADESLAASELLKFSAFLAPNDIPYHILIKGAAHLGETLKAYLQGEDEDASLLALSELLEPLSQYSLVKWEPEQASYCVHRLVQAVMRDGIDLTTQASWIKRATAAIATAYPGNDFKHWPLCAQLLPHWLQVHEHACSVDIESETLGAILNQAGFYLHDQGRYSEAEPLYQEALALYKRLLGNKHPAVATSLNNLASIHSAQGCYSEAKSLYQQALAMRKQLLGDEHPTVAISLNNLAWLYENQGNYSEAEPLYQEALTMRKRLLGDEHPDVAISLNNLAGLYSNQGRYSEAEPLYQEALTIRKRLLGDEHPDVATSLNNLAWLYENQGNYSEAKPLYQKALTIRKRLLGDEHPDVAASLNNLAALYNTQGCYSEAEPLYQEALMIHKRLLGDEHPDVATSLNNLAWLYENQGNYSEAEPLYQEALAMRKRLLGAEHPDVALSFSNLAGLYSNQGRYNEAEALYQEALAMQKRLLGAEHPAVATSLNDLALVYDTQERYSESEPLYLQSVGIAYQRLGESHPNTQTCWNNFADCLKQAIESGKANTLSDHPVTQGLLQQLQSQNEEGA